MPRKIVLIAMFSLLMILLASCSANSSPESQDPSLIKIDMTTDPSPVIAPQRVQVIAQVSGLIKQEGARIEFDIRKSAKALPELARAESDGQGRFIMEKSFEEPGTYIVYIHLYQRELHITKKKEIEVT